jgi:hypothetical protein
VIRIRLKHEGYTLSEINSHFAGKGLRDQIKSIRLAAQV